MKTRTPMRPLYAATLSAMESVVRRYYLRPATLSPVEGDPGRYDILLPSGRNKFTHVVAEDGRFKFCEQPARPAPSWDNEFADEGQIEDEDLARENFKPHHITMNAYQQFAMNAHNLIARAERDAKPVVNAPNPLWPVETWEERQERFRTIREKKNTRKP